MAIDYDNVGTRVKRPSYLAHVVLRTNDLKPMVHFYKTFLGAHASFENDFISFLTYDGNTTGLPFFRALRRVQNNRRLVDLSILLLRIAILKIWLYRTGNVKRMAFYQSGVSTTVLLHPSITKTLMVISWRHKSTTSAPMKRLLNG